MSDDLARRARSFGEQAALYDRARPSYPAELVDWLLAEPVPRVLDIGCGTGKAGTLFAARGCSVLGVEPDAQMAAVARQHDLAVEVARFEEWQPGGRRFELAICAQAWHWLDHEPALTVIAEALVPGGRFAAFWNFGLPEEEARPILDAAYDAHAPELEGAASPVRGASFDEVEDEPEPWARDPRFGPFEVRVFEWEDEPTVAQWIDLLRTHSDHALLPEARREGLFDAIAAGFGSTERTIRVHYRTRCVVVRRA